MTAIDSQLIQEIQHLPLIYKKHLLEYIHLLYKNNLLLTKEVGQSKNKEREIGFFPKGTFILSDDFDAPLGDFTEYM